MAEMKSYSLDEFVKNVNNGLKGQGPFGSYDQSVLQSMLNNIDGSINKARQEINQLAVKNKQDLLRRTAANSLSFKAQLGEIEKAFDKYGFGTAYEFNEKNGKLVVHVQPRDSANFTPQQRKDFERDIKIEFDTDVNQFGITTRNKQIASDNMRLRTHGGKTVLLSGIQSLAKDLNDAFKKTDSQLNKSLEYRNAAAVNRAIKDIVNTHNNHTATTGSNNFIKKDLKNERMQDSHRLKVAGKITPQQLNYNATKGAAIYYGDFLNDIVKETKESILKKQRLEKIEYARAEQMVIEDLNQILALSSTQNWQKNSNGKGSDQLNAFLGSMLGNKKYFTAKDKKTIVNYLASAALNGGGYGLGNESGYAQHRFTPNKASGSAPFGFGYSRENRAWMQAQAIATPRGRDNNRVNPLIAYNAGKAGRALVTSAYQQKLQKAYRNAQPGNQIDFSSEDQYNFAQISQAGLDQGLRAVEAQIKKLQSSAQKEDRAHAQKLQKEYLKFKDLGVTEGGMILKGDMKDELKYVQEINRTLHSDVNFQKMVDSITEEELNKYKSRKPFNKAYIKELKDKGLDELGVTAALKEKLAVYKLFGRDLKDPHRDFSYEKILDQDKNVTGFKILQQMMGQNAHRAVTDTGMRVAPSFAGPQSDEIFNIILKELGFQGDPKTIAGFIGMEKNYSDRKVGEQINGVLKHAVLEMEQAKTIGAFVDQFNQYYGKKMFTYSAKNGLVYHQNAVNSMINAGDKSQNMYDFYEAFFTFAGQNKATNPYEFKNGTAFLKDPNLLIQTMGINNSDIWTYGSAHNKGGKWMSVDDKVIGSLNRMLGEGDVSKHSIVEAIKKSYKVSEEDYAKTIKAVEDSYKLSYAGDKQVSEKTLELDLATLQQKYKDYASIKDKYTTDGRLSVEAFNASPLAWIQSQIQAKADELGVAKEEINAFVRLENGFELKDPYSGTSARGTALPINVFRGQKNFGSIEEIRDEMGELQGEIVQDVEGTSLDIINSFISKTFLSSAEAQEKAALEYIKDESDYFYTKEGGYFKKAHHGRLAHGAALTAISTNLKSGNEFLENGGVLVSPNQLRGMLKTQSGDAEEMAQNVTYLSDILGKMTIGDKRRARLAEKLKNAKTDQERESILANEVVRAVDITANTDKDLKTAGGQRSAAFKNAELLTLMNLRYPLIYGQDVGFGSLAASKNIEDSAIAMGMGNYRAHNADFDADKITVALISSILHKSQDEQGNDYFIKGKNATQRIAQTTDKYIQREYHKDEEEKLTKGMFDSKSLGRTDSLDSLIETLSRSNRSQIGTFSLINQAIREGMTDLGLDEATKTGKTAAQAALVRELFTSLEQDAISAKKLSKRFKDDNNLQKYIDKDGKLNAKGSEYLYKELENLKVQAFGEKSKVFEDKTATMNWLGQLQEFGVLGDDNKALFGAGKTQGRLNALFSALKPEEVASVLGIKPQELSDFLDPDKDDLKITREMLANALMDINAKWKESTRTEYKGGFGDVVRYKNKILNNYSSMTEYQLWKKYGPALANSQVLSDIYTPAQIDPSGQLGGFGGGSGNGNTRVPKKYSDKLTGKEIFSDSDLAVTTVLNTVFGNTFSGFTRKDYNDYNNILSDDQYEAWINSLQGASPEQKAANAKRILKEGWLYSGAGTYRHGLAQTKLMAQKFGIDNLDITNLENIRQAAAGNKKFSKWLNEKDKNSGLTMLESLANYEYLAKKFYGDGTVDYLSALTGNQQGAQNYYNMVMTGAQELLGSETTIRGKWGGRNVQGKIDFLRTTKRRNPYDEKSPEKLFLDVIDFKPGMTKAQYVAQIKKYADMLKPYEELALKHGNTGLKKSEAFAEFAKEGLISQFIQDNGKDAAKALFRVMTDKNYGGILDVGAWDDKNLSVMTQGLYSLDDQGKVRLNKHNAELLEGIGYAFANGLDISEIFTEDNLARLTKHDKIANTEITKYGSFQDYWGKLRKREDLNTKIATLNAKLSVTNDSEKREKYSQDLEQRREELSKFDEDNKLLFNQYREQAPELEKTLLDGAALGRENSRRAVYAERLSTLYGDRHKIHKETKDIEAKLAFAREGSAEAEELNLALDQLKKKNDLLKEQIKSLEKIKTLNGEDYLFSRQQLGDLQKEEKLLQKKEDHLRNAKLAETSEKQLEGLYKQARVGHGKEEDLKMRMYLAGKDQSPNGKIAQQEYALALQEQQELNKKTDEEIAQAEKASGFSDEQLKKLRSAQLQRQIIEDSIREAKLAQLDKDGTLRGFFSNFGANFGKQAKQFLMYQTSFNALFQKLRQGMKTIENQAKAMNKALVDLQIVTGNTKEQTMALLNSYTDLGQKLGATTTEVANAANSWLRQGYEAAEVNDLITSSLYLSKLGMIDTATATQNLTSMLKGFKLEATDAMSVVDKLVSVDMKAAASAGGIAEALSQFATTAQLSGLDMDKAIAMATTIMDVSQAAPSTAGNALKTILSRFGNVKAGSFEKLGDGEEGTSINDVERVVKTLGISLRSANGEMRDFSDVLEDVAMKWHTIDEVSKNALATAFAGTRQRESFLVLMENMDKYHELVEVSEDSAGAAIKKYQAYSESLEASQKRLAAAWEKLGNNVDLQHMMTQFNDILAKATTVLPILVKFAAKIAAMRLSSRLVNFFGMNTLSIGQGGWKKLGANIGNVRGMGLVGKENMLQQTAEKLRQAIERNTSAVNQSTQSQNSGTTDVSKKQNIMRGVAGGVQVGAGALMGYLMSPNTTTATDISGEDLNVALSDREKQTAKIWSGIGGASTAVPILGPIVSGLIDWGLNKDWFGYFGASKNAALAEQNAAVRGSQLSNISANFDDFSKAIAAGNVAGAKEQSDLIVDAMLKSENKQGREQFERYLREVLGDKASGRGIVEIMDSMNHNLADQKELSRALLQAELKAKKENLINSNTTNLMEQNERINNTFNTFKGKTADLTFGEGAGASALGLVGGAAIGGTAGFAAGAAGAAAAVALGSASAASIPVVGWIAAAIGATIAGGLGIYAAIEQKKLDKEQEIAETNYEAQLTLSDKVALVQKALDNTSVADTAQREEYQEMIEELKNAQQALYSFNKKVDALTIQEAVLAAKSGDINLADLSSYELKKLGAQGIEAIIDQALKDNNLKLNAGSFFDTNGNLTSYAAPLLEAALKQNSTLWNAYNGGSFTLNEALANGNTGLLQNFAAALNTSVDQLKTFKDELGDLQLSDFMSSISDLTEKIKKMSSSMMSLVDINTSSYDKQQMIITQYPELLEYIGDNAALIRELNKVKKEEIKLTGQKLLDQIMTDSVAYEKNFQEEVINIFDRVVTAPEKMRDETDEEKYNRLISADINMPILTEYRDFLEWALTTNGKGGIYNGRSYNVNNMPYGDLTGQISRLNQLINGFWPSQQNDIDTALQYIDRDDVVDSLMSKTPNLTDAYITDAWSRYSDLRKKITGATSIEQIINLLASADDMAEEAKEEILDYISTQTKDLKLFVDLETDEYLQGLTWVTHELDKQIDNLQQQKEALEEINNQREYENKLLEARNRLEEASKEKKRVWREGIGWVYEADQENIAAAEKELADLDNQKTISELEEQITQLQADKQKIADVQEEKRWEQYKELFNTKFDDLIGGDASVASVQAIVQSTSTAIEGLPVKFADKLKEEMDTAAIRATEYQDVIGKAKANVDKVHRAIDGVNTASLTESDLKNYDSAIELYNALIDQAVSQGYDVKGWGYEKDESENRSGQLSTVEHGGLTYSYDSTQTLAGITADDLKYGTNAAGKDSLVLYPLEGSYAGHKIIYNKSGKAHNQTTNQDIKDWKIDKNTDIREFLKSKGVTSAYIQTDTKGSVESSYYYVDGQLYRMAEYNAEGNRIDGLADLGSVNDIINRIESMGASNASGSLSFTGGMSLINELGTEAIVTPHGTITSLPSATGIVPADVTKNLWQLGKLAPAITQGLMMPGFGFNSTYGIKSAQSAVDESFNITTLNMNVTADDSFDADAFVQAIRTRAELSRNNR